MPIRPDPVTEIGVYLYGDPAGEVFIAIEQAGCPIKGMSRVVNCWTLLKAIKCLKMIFNFITSLVALVTGQQRYPLKGRNR
jgi:hypothetical protein